MIRLGLSAWISLGILCLGSLVCAVPITFQYQGHIVVDGLAFEGTGAFKFALLDENGATLWSNDETSSEGSEPVSNVEIVMSRGVYLVELGNATVANMAAIPASVFDVDSVFLRVWFDDGVNGSQQLAPDTAIGSVAFAIRAASAERADTADTVSSLPDGLIESHHLESTLQQQIETLTGLLDNLVAISSDEQDEALTGAGYAAFRTIEEDSWIAGSSDGRPSGRYGHSGIWTGDEFLVWGGLAGGANYLDSGGRYSPASDAWSTLSTLDGPDARRGHSAVWTGENMIIWGGLNGGGRLNSGGRYISESKEWYSLATSGAPEGRNRHIAVWSGASMLVWGGRGNSWIFSDGGAYDPELNEWTSFDLVSVPTDESYSPTILTEVVDWGEGSSSNWTNGVDEEGPFLDGASHVSVNGDYAYIASSADDSISIFNVLDPAEPRLVYSILFNSSNENGPFPLEDGSGSYSDIGSNQGINGVWFTDVVDELLIASANSSQTVSFFDIRFPSEPVFLGSIVDTDDAGDLSHLDRPRWVRVTGDVAVVGNDSFTSTSTGINSGPAAVNFFNIADPSAPVFLNKIVDGNTILTSDGADFVLNLGVGNVEFDVSGDLLFLSAGAEPNLHILNIEDPLDPRVIVTLEDGVDGYNYLGVPRVPTLSDDGLTLFVASSGGEDALSIIDVSIPSAPALLAELKDGVDGFDFLDGPLGVSVEGNLLAVTGLNDDAITLIDVTELSAPKLIAQYTNFDGDAFALDGALGVDLVGEIAYVTSNRSDSLTLVDARKSPRARMDAVGAWTGEELLVWGGRQLDSDLGDGFRVAFSDASTPSEWAYMSEVDAPTARSGHAGVWTGEEFIVWGGWSGVERLSDGGKYDPDTDAWTALASDGAPSARTGHTAVWTGSEMLILFGFDGTNELADGYAYDPAKDQWRTLSSSGDPLARRNAVAVWAGTEVMVYGGRASGSVLRGLQRLNPAPAVHLFRKQ